MNTRVIGYFGVVVIAALSFVLLLNERVWPGMIALALAILLALAVVEPSER